MHQEGNSTWRVCVCVVISVRQSVRCCSATSFTTTGTRRDTHSVSICLSHAVRHTDICVSHRRRGSVARIAAGSVVQSVGGEVPLPMGDSFLSCRRSARCTAAEGGAGEDGAWRVKARLSPRKFEEIHVQLVASLDYANLWEKGGAASRPG